MPRAIHKKNTKPSKNELELAEQADGKSDDKVMLGKRVGAPISNPKAKRVTPKSSKGGRPVDPNSKRQQAIRARAAKDKAGTRIGGKGKRGESGEIVGNMPQLTLTAEVHKTIVDAVERGNWRSVAYQMAGVRPDTFYLWIKRGEKHLREILDGTRGIMTRQAHLVLDLAKAEGRLHDFHSQKILQEAKPELRFAWLGKRFPKEWGDPGISRDDKTGEETKVDLISSLMARLSPLVGESGESGDSE